MHGDPQDSVAQVLLVLLRVRIAAVNKGLRIACLSITC